ncbi:MAG: hypothetical protein HOJ35_09020 [Bdellovibrionales bacterium]|nr:hypothetical protein [Bdellovibrionales bacterium]
MSQIIIVQENMALRELLELNLVTYLNAEIINRENADDVIQLLDILPNIELIICQNNVQNEATAIKLIQYLKDKKLPTCIIVMGELADQYFDNDNIINIINPHNWEEVVDTSSKILGIELEALTQNIGVQYVPIPIEYFAPLTESCCDIFVKIKKGPTYFQFIKRVQAHKKIDQEMLLRYQGNGVTHLYIQKEMQKILSNYISNHLTASLEQQNQSLDDEIETLHQSYQISKRELLNIGITSSSIQLTDAFINTIQQQFNKKSKIAPLFIKVINSPTSYLYQLCHLTCLLSFEILEKLNLTDNEDRKKIAYAVYFSDISLLNHQELCKINSAIELERQSLDEDLFYKVYNHALIAARFIRKYPNAPLNVDEIIKEHHGSYTGKGFQKGPFEKLLPLSRVYIIAEACARKILQYKEHKQELKPIYPELCQKFNHPSFNKVLKALNAYLKLNKLKEKDEVIRT